MRRTVHDICNTQYVLLCMFPISLKRIIMIYYTVGKCDRGSLANGPFLSIWRKKVWQINRPASRLLIVSTNFDTNLDDFSFTNHGRFTKFVKLSCYTVCSHVLNHCSLVASCLDNFMFQTRHVVAC